MDPSTEDRSLTLAAREGDREAFETLIQRHYSTVYLTALAHLHSPDAAEDLAQEVFLRAFLSLRALNAPDRFGPWVVRVARNLAIDWVRHGQRSSRLLPTLSLDESTMEIPDYDAERADARLAREEEGAALRDALQTLPVEIREVVLLHYAEDLTFSEIGDRLGVHRTTVKRQVDKALGLLRGKLEPWLRRSAVSLRPGRSAVARASHVILVASALSAASRAALIAEAGPIATVAAAGLTGAGVGGGAATLSAGAGGGGVWAAFSQLPSTLLAGIQAMTVVQKLAAVLGVIALALGGGVAYRQFQTGPAANTPSATTPRGPEAAPEIPETNAAPSTDATTGEASSADEGGKPLGEKTGGGSDDTQPTAPAGSAGAADDTGHEGESEPNGDEPTGQTGGTEMVPSLLAPIETVYTPRAGSLPAAIPTGIPTVIPTGKPARNAANRPAFESNAATGAGDATEEATTIPDEAANNSEVRLPLTQRDSPVPYTVEITPVETLPAYAPSLIDDGFELRSATIREIVSQGWSTRRSRVMSDVPLPETRYHIRIIAGKERGRSWPYDEDPLKEEILAQELEWNWGLTVRRGTRMVEAYVLTAPNGTSAALAPSKTPPGSSTAHSTTQNYSRESEGDIMHLTCVSVPIGDVASSVEGFLESPVLDETRLTGRYDFEMKFRSDDRKGSALKVPKALGLELTKERRELEMVVIGRAAR